MGRLDVIGEIVVDLVEVPGGLLRPVPGGSPANVALAAARLGTPTRLRARIGSDALAARCRAHLADNGVDLDRAVTAAEPATVALASIGTDGSAHYDFWVTGTADWQWRPDELADLPAEGTVAVHTGSLASWMPPGGDVVLAALRRAHESDRVSVSYDPNVRAALMGGREAAVGVVEEYARCAHIVKASDEDVAWLYPGVEPADVLRHWHGLGVTLAVLTRGGHGATGSLADGRAVDVAAPAVTVVDTVGAGDTFTGALLHALEHRDRLGAQPAHRLAAMHDDELGDVVRWAATAAAVTCSRAGCDPPSAAEVLALR